MQEVVPTQGEEFLEGGEAFEWFEPLGEGHLFEGFMQDLEAFPEFGYMSQGNWIQQTSRFLGLGALLL